MPAGGNAPVRRPIRDEDARLDITADTKAISPTVGVTISGEDFDVLFTMFERLTSPYSTLNELAEIIRFENQIRRWLQAIKTGEVGASLSGPARSAGELQ